MLFKKPKKVLHERTPNETMPSINSRLRPFFIEHVIEGYENLIMGIYSYGDRGLKLIHTGLIAEKDIVEKFKTNFKPENNEEKNEYQVIVNYLKPLDALCEEIIAMDRENLSELSKQQLTSMMDYYENRIRREITESGAYEIATNRHFIYLLIKLLKTIEFNEQLQEFDKFYIDYFKANPTKLKIWNNQDVIEPNIFDNSYWWWHLDKLNDLTEKELSSGWASE